MPAKRKKAARKISEEKRSTNALVLFTAEKFSEPKPKLHPGGEFDSPPVFLSTRAIYANREREPSSGAFAYRSPA